MMGMRRAGGVLVGGALCVAVAAGGRLPWSPTPEQPGLVRLSWRAVLPMVEECHAPTEEDVRGLPSHMRPTEICSGRSVPFRLLFVLDGDTLVDERVVGAGAREDRPMYVLHERAVVPGTHDLLVDFGPDPSEGDAAGAVQGSRLSQRVDIGPLVIALVTQDGEGRLVLR